MIGAGGLGCPAALYLASAGVGHLILVDDDEVDQTNLQRQVLHTQARVGQAKVTSARQALLDINPDIQITALKERASAERLLELVAQADVVLDCCDNFETRHAVNRACVAHQKPLVSGAAIKFDGQLAVFDLRHETSPCYHCLFPDGQSVGEVRCATMGVFAPLTGVIGTLQAAEALKILADCGQTLNGQLILFDGRASDWNRIKVQRDPGCTVCSHRH